MRSWRGLSGQPIGRVVIRIVDPTRQAPIVGDANTYRERRNPVEFTVSGTYKARHIATNDVLEVDFDADAEASKAVLPTDAKGDTLQASHPDEWVVIDLVQEA